MFIPTGWFYRHEGEGRGKNGEEGRTRGMKLKETRRKKKEGRVKEREKRKTHSNRHCEEKC